MNEGLLFNPQRTFFCSYIVGRTS